MDNTLIYSVDSDASTVPESDCETDSDGRQDQSQFQSIPPNNTIRDKMKPACQRLSTNGIKISEQTITDSSSDDCDSQNIFQSQRSQQPRRKKRSHNCTLPLEVLKRDEMQNKAKSVWQQLNKEENRLKFKHLLKKACKSGEDKKNLKSSQTQENTSTSINITNSFNQSRSPVFRRKPGDSKLSLKKNKPEVPHSPIIIDSEESPVKGKDFQHVDDKNSSDSDCIIMSSDETNEPSFPSSVTPKVENPKPSPTFSDRSASLENNKKTDIVCLKLQRQYCLNVSSPFGQCNTTATSPVASLLDKSVPNLSQVCDISEDSWDDDPPPILTQYPQKVTKSDTNKTAQNIKGNKLLSNSDNSSKILSDSHMFTEFTNYTVSNNVGISECIEMLDREALNDGKHTTGLFYTSTPKLSSSKQKIVEHAVKAKTAVHYASEQEIAVKDHVVTAKVRKMGSMVEDVPVGNDKLKSTAQISSDGITKNQGSSNTGTYSYSDINKPPDKLQDLASSTTSTTHNTTQEESSTTTSHSGEENGVEVPTTPDGSIHQLETNGSKKSTNNGETTRQTDQQISNITVSLPSCEGSNVDLAVVKEETTKDQEVTGEFHYSVVDTVVHVFDSDDEELFYTQSIFGTPQRGNKESHGKNKTETFREDSGGLPSSSTVEQDIEEDETVDSNISDDPWDEDMYMAHTQVDYIQDDQEDATKDGDIRHSGKPRSHSPIADVDSPNWDFFNDETQIDPFSPEVTSPIPENIFEMETQPIKDGVVYNAGKDVVEVTDSDDDPYLVQTQADSVKILKKDGSRAEKKMVDPYDIETQVDILPDFSMKPFDVATQHDSKLEYDVNVNENVYGMATQYDSLSEDDVNVDENAYSIATLYDSVSEDDVNINEDVHSQATLLDSPVGKQKSGENVECSKDIHVISQEECDATGDVSDFFQMATQLDSYSTLQTKVSDFQQTSSENAVTALSSKGKNKSDRLIDKKNYPSYDKNIRHISSKSDQIVEKKEPGETHVDNFSSTTQEDKEEITACQTTTKIQKGSKNSFDVNENNIVEYMASTQVDPRLVTPKVRHYCLFPKKKPDATLSEGLFDKFSAELKKVNNYSTSYHTKSVGSKMVTSKLKPRKEAALSSNLEAKAEFESIPLQEQNWSHMSQQDTESPEVFQANVSSEDELSSSLSDISEDSFTPATKVDDPDTVAKPGGEKLVRNDLGGISKTQGIKNTSSQSIEDKNVSSGEEKRPKSDKSCSESDLTSELFSEVERNHSIKEALEQNNADVVSGDYRLRTSVMLPLQGNETYSKSGHNALFRSKSADQVQDGGVKTLSKSTPSVPPHKSVANIPNKNDATATDSSTSVEPQNENGVKKSIKRSFSSVEEYASLSSGEKDKLKHTEKSTSGRMAQPERPTKSLKATCSVKSNVKTAAPNSKLPAIKRSSIDMEQNKSPIKRQKKITSSGSWLSASKTVSSSKKMYSYLRIKQKDSGKKIVTSRKSINQNIEAAKQCMLEREMKAPTALHKSNADQLGKAAHHANDEDVEMPSTQDIMARGLPILTALLPVNKMKLNLGLPSQGKLASEDRHINNNSVASGENEKSETELKKTVMSPLSVAPTNFTAPVFTDAKESITKSSDGEPFVRISTVTIPNPTEHFRKHQTLTVQLNNFTACAPHKPVSAVPSLASCSLMTSCQKSSVDRLISVKPTADQQLPRSILKQYDKLSEKKTVNFRDSQNTCKLIESVSTPFREQLREVPQPSPEFTISVLFKILSWNTKWLSEYDKALMGSNKTQKPPLLGGPSDNYSRLRMYFETFKEYVQITSNLLILETWESIYQDWKLKTMKKAEVVLDGLPYYPNGKDGKKEQVPLVIEVIGVMSRSNRRDQLCKDDLLILRGFGKPKDIEPIWNEQFALVQSIRLLWDKGIRWLNKLYPHLKIADSILKEDILIYKLTLKIKYQVNYFPSKPMEITKISSLKTLLRQLDALTLLPDNPLCAQLLCPSERNVFFHNQVEPGAQLNSKLNTEQAKAVANIKSGVLMSPKAKKVFFLQGPAGTGKTQTIMALIHQILLSSGFKARICLATPSNAAVDEIAKRIIWFSQKLREGKKDSISLVRIGNRDCINPIVKPFYWETLVKEQCKAHMKAPDSLQNELEHYRRKVQSFESELADPSVPRVQKASKDADLLQLTNKIRSLESELHNKKPTIREEYQAKCSVMDNAHVICGTLSSFGLETVKAIVLRKENHRHKDQPFTCLIIDEATQAIEVDCLIPLQYKMTKVVLVGDQKQLPATVLSQKANELELSRSLFERLNLCFEEMQKGSSFQSPIMMLVRQYRMNPEVLALPNNLFYDGKLKTDESVLNRRCFLAPYLVFDVQGGKESSNERSLSNVPEAECTASLCSIVMEVLKESPNTIHNRIGVICPYADQKKTILSHLRKRHLDRIEVNTVDGFQGQERDVIIMSCVRAQNYPTTIGFLADKRRMNVSLTRAKHAMYVMGHFETLKTNGLWAELYQDACFRKLLIDIRDAGSFSRVAERRVDLRKHPVQLDR